MLITCRTNVAEIEKKIRQQKKKRKKNRIHKRSIQATLLIRDLNIYWENCPRDWSLPA